MNKRGMKYLTCTLLTALMLSISACSGGNGQASTQAQTESVETDAPETKQTETATDAPETETPEETSEESSDDTQSGTAAFASMEEFANSDMIQSELDAQLEQLEAAGLTMEITGEGNKLINTYFYKDMVADESLAASLEAGLESQKSTFEYVASTLEAAVAVENPVVVVRYVDSEGTEIISKEFQASDDAVPSDLPSATGKYSSIEDFVNSDVVQSQLATQMEAYESSGLVLDVYGEDNKLVYALTLPEGTDTEGLSEVMASEMEAQASTFQSIAASLTAAVEVENPVVVVKYLAFDGTEIYSQEFTAE